MSAPLAMEPAPARRSRLVCLLGYVFATASCVALLTWILRLWEVDLTLPFTYSGDTLAWEMLVQGTVENGWYLHNNRLGAPHGLDMRDYPFADSLHFGVVRLIGLAVDDPRLAFNLFFLLTYPLITLTTLFVLRRFGLSYAPALVASLLYTFLPFHLLRNCQIFFTAYYLVPLMVLVAVWLHQDEFLSVRDGDKPRLYWRGGKFLAAVLVCALMGCGGVYYAFFGCFFLMVAALTAALTRKATAPLWAGGALIAVIGLAGLANGIPYFQARFELGANADSMRRSPAGAELYGLKVAQLLLPVTNHRLPILARGKDLYNQKMPLVTENDHSSLGVVGAIGFLILIGCLLARRSATTRSQAPPGNALPRGSASQSRPAAGEAEPRESGFPGRAWEPVGERPPLLEERPPLLEALSTLNLFAVLLAAIGGFGFFVCLVMPEIRSFNRISVYIGFFALTAVAVCLQYVQTRLARTPGKRLAFGVLLLLLVVGGVLDQTPSPLPYFQQNEEVRQDAAFVQEIERSVPAGAMIFQLPYVPFPENPPVQRMSDYDHVRGYLHSRTLKWSYPTMRGRWGDTWQKAMAQKPLEELLPALTLAGFSGVYIDRFGFADGAAALERELARILPAAPVISANGRLAFFRLTDYAARLRTQYEEKEWHDLRQRVLTLQPASFRTPASPQPQAVY